MATTEPGYLSTLESATASARALIKTMRPKQWTKNAVVFAPLVFGGSATDLSAVVATAIAALLFCLTSSVTYILNDLMDAAADRMHPLKRHRPIASGQLSPSAAWVAIAVLVAIIAGSSLALEPRLALVLLAYASLNVLYSLKLKHVTIVDVFIIAAGFVLRALAGAVVTDIPLSTWLYLCTVLLALFLGFGKRRHEVVLLADEASAHRPSLDGYSIGLLDELITIVAASTIMAYSLYTFFAPNVPTNHSMMLTIPFVLYGLFRYLYLIHQRGAGGSPEQLLLEDPPLLLSLALWGVTILIVIYAF